MAQGNGLDGERTILEYHLSQGGVNRMEYDLIVDSGAEHLHFRMEQWLVCFRGIYVEWGSAALQAESAYHGNKSQYMVAVYVADEYGLQF